MKNKILWGFTLLPTLVTCVVIQFIEGEIPVHYDALGTIDRWGSKYELFVFPIIIIVMTILWKLLIGYFSKKEINSKDEKIIQEAGQNKKVIYYVAVGMAVLFSILHYSFMYSGIIEVQKGMETMAIDINSVTNISMGVFMIIIGNMIPKSKCNSVVGLRTKWCMKNDVTWAKSNRFGGISLVIAGLLIIIESLLIGGFLSTIIMLFLLIIAGVVSTIYSYKIAKDR